MLHLGQSLDTILVFVWKDWGLRKAGESLIRVGDGSLACMSDEQVYMYRPYDCEKALRRS